VSTSSGARAPELISEDILSDNFDHLFFGGRVGATPSTAASPNVIACPFDGAVAGSIVPSSFPDELVFGGTGVPAQPSLQSTAFPPVVSSVHFHDSLRCSECGCSSCACCTSYTNTLEYDPGFDGCATDEEDDLGGGAPPGHTHQAK
jgi:hypothetical protein